MPPPARSNQLDQHRAEQHLGELLAGADDQPADDRARDRGEAAEDQHRQRLERDQRDRELHAELGAPHHAGGKRDDAGDRPHDQPDRVERDADRLRRLVVVGDRAQRAADARDLEEDREHRDQDGADDRGDQLVADRSAGRRETPTRTGRSGPSAGRDRSCRCRCPRSSGRSLRGNRRCPSVAMNRMMPSWLTRRRSTRNSIA